MKKISCIIIEDEELARKLLENFIARISHLELHSSFSNPMNALPSIQKGEVDLIFLDIQMPEINGVDFLKSLKNPPAVIFTTAYSKYALEGYELSVIDYLLKPFSFKRFLNAINRASEIIELRQKEISYKPSNFNVKDSVSSEFLLINADHKIHRLYLKDLRYIQSLKEYVVYFTEEGKIMALGSLKSLEEKLPANDFLRIHKSYIVAKNRVRSLEGNQLDVGGIKLPIGGSYRNEVKEKLFK